MAEVIYRRGGLPPTREFGLYRKKTLTQACRITGPFAVITREGILDCPDGWLALDSEGWPYPIAADVFEATYEAAP